MKQAISALLLCMVIVLMQGCSSKLKDKLPVEPTFSGLHGTEYMDPSNRGLHGQVLKTDSTALAKCRTCHSLDASGGSSKRSCFGADCHAGVHDSLVATPGSQNFHGTQLNAGTVKAEQCMLCHSYDPAGGIVRVSCATPGCHGHENGFADPSADNFHGKKFPIGQADMKSCVRCHSLDATGGTAHRSCFGTGCHVGTHDANIGKTGAPGFHAQQFQSGAVTIASCLGCHSVTPDGGYAKRSCFSVGCHAGIHDKDMGKEDTPNFHGQQFERGTITTPGCMDCHAYKTGGGYAQRSCFGSGCHSVTHKNGIDDPGSPNFHGKILQASGYNLDPCKTCHGQVFDGGKSGYSCNHSGCHSQADGGPAACYTCHGDWSTKQAWPNTPSHRTHIQGGSTTNTTVQCAGCHTVPSQYSDPGHMNPTQIVTITAPLALTQTTGTNGTPSYSSSTKKCSNVYCHGNFTNGNNFSPTWDGANQATCGSCHGLSQGNPLPKPTHLASDACSGCHIGVVDANKTVIDKVKHLNGKLDRYGSDTTNW